MNSMCLEEFDLEDNLIGDVGGRELADGLTYRKERKVFMSIWISLSACAPV